MDDQSVGYMFADLAELDAITTQWRAEREKIKSRTDKINQAIERAVAPADDPMSIGQVQAFTASLLKLQEYNEALLRYADGYVRKLEAARGGYSAIDETNRARLTQLHPGT